MDFVPVIDGFSAQAASINESLSANWASWLVLTAIVVGLFAFVRKIWRRASRTVEDTVFSNWRLALLGATGIVLSLASGWTTWDGMRNFTSEPILSLMITFGIQGVMLIVAWLIGESFATGMHQRAADRAVHTAGIIGGIIAAIIIVGGVVLLLALDRLPFATDQLLFVGVFLAIVALIAVLQWDLVHPYLQSSRIIVRNAVLWVMFLATMTTSVFFSFDSLFSAIFPAEERQRAAQLRAQNQVAGIVADIGQTISARQLQEAEALFGNDGWRAYETQLDELTKRSQGSQSAIEAYFVEQMEQRRQAIAQQQERIATAESSKVGLAAKKIQLTDEVSRLKAERPSVATQVISLREVVDRITGELEEQRAKTLAEERGVEGSGKVGRGKFWRESKAAEAQVAGRLEVARRRLKTPQSRLDEIDKRAATIKAELAQIDGQLAQLQGEASTAQRRIATAEQARQQAEAEQRVDPAQVLPAFERAKAEFRQEPTVERLNALYQQCGQLLNAMLSTPATKENVRGIDCDPKQASEAASVVFALNTGAQAFASNCAGGDKLEQNSSTDGLFGFARKCLSDSGLPSKETDSLRTNINLAELNRDDKAHRFVVTWNAFQDGNRLAYLALGIAIAIDLLVFMSGLFGANAVRSPLQDVPSLKPRSAAQLEAIIENALMPEKYDNALAVLDAMKPVTPVNGYTQEVVIPYQETAQKSAVVKVLNAGAAIGAVARDPGKPDHYLVRPELFEFVSIIAKKCFDGDQEHVRSAELRQVVTVALQPYVGDHAEVVLNNMTPISKRAGDFSSVIIMPNVSLEDQPVVKKMLNAGTTTETVKQSELRGEEDYYLVHSKLYRTIAMIAATTPKVGKRLGLDQIAGRGAHHGGDITPKAAGLGHAAPSQIADQSDALSESELSSLQDIYRSELIAPLGIGSEAAGQLLAQDAANDAAHDAWNALAHHARNNRVLGKVLNSFEGQNSTDVNNVFDQLKADVASDAVRSDVLNDVRQEVNDAWPKLMLHPDAGLIETLINQLEIAAASDDGQQPGEQELHERLRIVNTSLKNLDLEHEVSWRQIENVLLEEHAGADVPKVLQLKPKQNGTSG